MREAGWARRKWRKLGLGTISHLTLLVALRMNLDVFTRRYIHQAALRLFLRMRLGGALVSKADMQFGDVAEMVIFNPPDTRTACYAQSGDL